jgi:hypothetical protein
MTAYCPQKSESFIVSMLEIVETSDEARIWVAGFLAGNEPEGNRMYGEQFFEFADDDPQVERWREALRLFRRTGAWEADRICERCGAEMLPSEMPGLVCGACRSAERTGSA